MQEGMASVVYDSNPICALPIAGPVTCQTAENVVGHVTTPSFPLLPCYNSGRVQCNLDMQKVVTLLCAVMNSVK
jgi:hypothetical protein